MEPESMFLFTEVFSGCCTEKSLVIYDYPILSVWTTFSGKEAEGHVLLLRYL